MLLSKLLHVAYWTQTVNLPLSSVPAISNWAVLTRKNIPVGPGHNVKFFLGEVGVM